MVLYPGLILMKAAKGFPLDDAYIYFQYVENLAAGNGLVFNEGETSFGVTSITYPLLSMLVSFLPGIDTIRAMQGVGIMGHLMLVWFGQRFLYSITGQKTTSLFGGMLLALCWPVLMTAPSGLETVLFHGIAVLYLWLLVRTPGIHPIGLGVCAGLLFLTRPEGFLFGLATLVFTLVHCIVFDRERLKHALVHCGFLVSGFVATTLPYMLFVYFHIGSLMPSTFTGKLLNRNPFPLWPWIERIRRGVVTIFEGYIDLIRLDPMGLSFISLVGLSLVAILVFTYRAGQSKPTRGAFVAYTTLSAMLLFPFLFGFAFFIFPRFGGYAERYIQFVVVAVTVLGVIGLSGLIRGITNTLLSHPWNERVSIGLITGIAILWIGWIGNGLLSRMDNTVEFFHQQSVLKQGVRMQAAEWIRQNTPRNSRVLVGSTGLGVVGSYSDRYCKDEAGLINPDIFPYLKQFQIHRRLHWPAMLEYMKAQSISYYTSYKSIIDTQDGFQPSRYTTQVATILNPALVGHSNLDRFSTIEIFRFATPEHYEMWDDAPDHLSFLDRNEPPSTDNRFLKDFWGEHPVVALLAQPRYFEMHYPILFPDNARLTTGMVAQFLPAEIQQGDWAKFNVYVDYHMKRTVLHEQENDLATLQPGVPFDSLQLDLSEWSNKYATLVFAVSARPEDSSVWLGWVRPQVTSAKDTNG